jgi:hypothetical protein
MVDWQKACVILVMNTPIDPIWIASQLQMTPAQLAAVPFAVIALLWLASRMSQKSEDGNYVAISRTGQVLRFLTGFACGLFVLLMAVQGFQLLAGRLGDMQT